MPQTIKGNLTALLKPIYQRLGYALSEDPVFIYLWHEGVIIKVYPINKSVPQQIEMFIKSREMARV